MLFLYRQTMWLCRWPVSTWVAIITSKSGNCFCANSRPMALTSWGVISLHDETFLKENLEALLLYRQATGFRPTTPEPDEGWMGELTLTRRARSSIPRAPFVPRVCIGQAYFDI